MSTGVTVEQTCLDVEVQLLREFVNMSATIGQNPMFVQGGGGNTSLKIKDTMWVKASGKWLGDACIENVFVAVDYCAMRSDSIAGIERNPIAYVRDQCNLRPSIETGMHALIEKPVVIHAHPVDVLAYAVQSNGERVCAKLLENMNWSWIPYVQPGWELTKAVASANEADVLILQNHGIVVAGMDCASALETLNQVVECFRSNVRDDHGRPDFEYLHSLVIDGEWHVPDNPELHGLALDPLSLQWVTGGRLSPDEVIFLGDRALTLDEECGPTECWEAAAASAAVPPPYLLIPNKGVLLRRTITRGAEAMLLAHARMLKRICSGTQLSYLADRDIAALTNWDAEKYRQSIERSRQSEVG